MIPTPTPINFADINFDIQSFIFAGEFRYLRSFTFFSPYWLANFYATTRDVESAVFELLLHPSLALPLPPLEDAIFAQNFLILKFIGKKFFHISQDKTALLLSSWKHRIEWLVIAGYGRSQDFEFGAAQKRKVKSHGCYVSLDVYFSERSPRILK